MSAAPVQPDRHVRWAPERFYWALLDAPGVRRAGLLPEGLVPLLEEEVPASAGPLHAVGAPIGRGRLVVCACPRGALESMGEALSLAPASLPECLHGPVHAGEPGGVTGGVSGAIDPAALNLLVGPFEPGPLRRARARRAHLAALATLCGALLVALGLLRRAWHAEREAGRAQGAGAAVLAGLGLDDESTLAAELDHLRRAAALRGPLAPAPDAALALAQVLAAWPTQVPCKPQSLSVTGTSASISVLVEQDPAGFLQALRPPRGWRLEEPRLNTVGGGVRLSLELRRSTGEPEGGTP